MCNVIIDIQRFKRTMTQVTDETEVVMTGIRYFECDSTLVHSGGAQFKVYEGRGGETEIRKHVRYDPVQNKETKNGTQSLIGRGNTEVLAPSTICSDVTNEQLRQIMLCTKPQPIFSHQQLNKTA